MKTLLMRFKFTVSEAGELFRPGTMATLAQCAQKKLRRSHF